jgi:predicted ATPase
VLISGEAGIGKSRLSAWVAEQSAQTPHTRLRYQCSPYHRDSALYPFAQQFERAAGIAAQDNSEAKLVKLEKVLSLATDRLGEVAPLIAAMLSIPTGTRYPPLNLSPAQQRRQTLFALLDQMEGLARKQPVLMLFEDAHWVDATSLEVLDLAIERMRKRPVLLLVTFRPEFEAPWKGLPDVADIALGRLERSQAESLISQVTGGRKLPPEVLAQIVAKTDGVPLFVEELTKNVLESGLLIEEADHYRLDGRLPPLAIPSTLKDSLMARLDRLAAVKEIAQVGAAIGREFSYPLLQAVVGRDEATLRASLAQLEESELVLRAGDPPAARYTFKHALVQDTAYESLLKSRRQILHQHIAEALRDKFPDVVEAEPELIAEHYTRAGLTEPAIVHWGKAGDLALRRSAFKEAIAHLGKAIEMTESVGAGEKEKADGKLKLQVSFGNALISARGYGAPETTAAFLRARESSAAGKDAPERFSVNYGVWVGSYLRGELPDMRAHAATFLTDVGSQTDRPEAGVAERVAGITHLAAGEYVEARFHLERALSLFNPERDSDQAFRFGHDSGLGAMVYLAHALWVLGEVDRACRLMEAARARMAKLTHVGSIAYGHFHAAVFELMRGDFASAAVDGVATEHLAREHDLNLWRALGVFLKGWAAWRQGERDVGMAEMRRGSDLLDAQKAVIFDGMLKIALAQSEAESGDLARALATLDIAIASSERTGQRTHAAELHRVRGDILLAQNLADPAPAEAAFLTAIAIAQQQKARSFELRAALALVKLHHSTGRPTDAHDILGPALEGFTSTPEFPQITEAMDFLAAVEAAG